MSLLWWIIIGLVLFTFILGIRIIRPTHRGVVETLGKYTGFREPGFTWIVPFIQQFKTINVTERLADVDPRTMISKDNLNIRVDLQVYYKVKSDEGNIKKAMYNVHDVESQIVDLAQTTARNEIGTMSFKNVNSERGTLNKKLFKTLMKETDNWGIHIVRVELREITPPQNVQETMNRVVMAENEKDAAGDFADAAETEADGKKRADIKEAEGIAQARKTVADANAYQIKIENEAAQKHFKKQAVRLKELEVAESSMKENSKIILGKDSKDILKLFDIGKEVRQDG